MASSSTVKAACGSPIGAERGSPGCRPKAKDWPFILPALNVTTMCFAGPDYKTLYIATARDGMDDAALAAMPLSGSLFILETDVKGLPEPLMRMRFNPG